MRVFLDANILFSASKSGGAIRELLKVLRDRGHHLVADAFVIEEARRNLARKATIDGLESLQTLLTVIEVGPTTTMPPNVKWLEWLPEKDRPVLASAVAQHCDALVTGDRTHFGAGFGKRFEGVKLLSPAMAFDELA